jgi:hypothetical protein
MKLLKWVIARLLQVSLVSVLFLVSCVGTVELYAESSKWLLKAANVDEDSQFHVAFISKSGEQDAELMVLPYRDMRNGYQDSESSFRHQQYHLPEEHMSFSWGAGEGGARIRATNEPDGSQLVRVFVTGDTPWSSLSEYRVVENKIHPLRYGDSTRWIVPALLLGMIILPSLIVRSIKPIGVRINRLMGVDFKQ